MVQKRKFRHHFLSPQQASDLSVLWSSSSDWLWKTVDSLSLAQAQAWVRAACESRFNLGLLSHHLLLQWYALTASHLPLWQAQVTAMMVGLGWCSTTPTTQQSIFFVVGLWSIEWFWLFEKFGFFSCWLKNHHKWVCVSNFETRLRRHGYHLKTTLM